MRCGKDTTIVTAAARGAAYHGYVALLKRFSEEAEGAGSTYAQDAWCAAFRMVSEILEEQKMTVEERVGVSLELQNIIRQSHFPVIKEASGDLIKKLVEPR